MTTIVSQEEHYLLILLFRKKILHLNGNTVLLAQSLQLNVTRYCCKIGNRADQCHQVVVAALNFSSINRLHFEDSYKVQVLLFLQMEFG